MSIPRPAFLNKYSINSPLNQREPWEANNQWSTFLKQHPHVAEQLKCEVSNHGGIRRSYLMSLADGDPEEFFLSLMAWGFAKSHVHYPSQVALMTPPFERENLKGIIDTVQNKGSLAGWKAILNHNKIYGLGYGFGTKLLYFAGYGKVPSGPQPLILDSRVMSTLANEGKVPGLIWSSDYDYANSRNYLRYLELAEEWAADTTWNGSPDAVEFALFSEAK